VNARSDDLLALQAEQQLELELSGKAEVMLSLKSDSEILISQSKTFTNCSLVRPVTPSPPSQFQERRKEMKEIEKFLAQDSWRFAWIAKETRETSPGPDRDKMMDDFWKSIWKTGYYKAEYGLIKARCWYVCRYVALWDEQLSDVSGQREDQERRERRGGEGKIRCFWVSARGPLVRATSMMVAAMQLNEVQKIRRTGVVRYSLWVPLPGPTVTMLALSRRFPSEALSWLPS
jgi:hypothetical protein